MLSNSLDQLHKKERFRFVLDDWSQMRQRAENHSIPERVSKSGIFGDWTANKNVKCIFASTENRLGEPWDSKNDPCVDS